MEILTLKNTRVAGIGAKTGYITAYFQDGKTVSYDEGQNVTQIIGIFLEKGFRAPQNEIGKFINKATMRMINDDSPVWPIEHSLVLMKN